MAVVSIMKKRKGENKGRRKARQGREGRGPKVETRGQVQRSGEGRRHFEREERESTDKS
jgi:hypothetical protein